MAAAVVALGIAAGRQIQASARAEVYSPAAVPRRPVALVFGAGVLSDGGPSSGLLDRVLTAVDLYKAGKVKNLFMTGDYSRPSSSPGYR